MEAGLPNITGYIEDLQTSYTQGGFPPGTGSFYSSYKAAGGVSSAATSDSYKTTAIHFGFDASYSNSIYGNSYTVQPPALTTNYVIKY